VFEICVSGNNAEEHVSELLFVNVYFLSASPRGLEHFKESAPKFSPRILVYTALLPAQCYSVLFAFVNSYSSNDYYKNQIRSWDVCSNDMSKHRFLSAYTQIANFIVIPVNQSVVRSCNVEERKFRCSLRKWFVWFVCYLTMLYYLQMFI